MAVGDRDGLEAGGLELHAVVTSLDGSRAIRYKKMGTRSAAAALGREVAEHLLREGAAEILSEARPPSPEARQFT